MINTEKVKKDWMQTYQELIDEAEFTKQSMIVPFGMLSKYDSLDKDEKDIINDVLIEWLIDDSSSYDAVFIIRERHLVCFIRYVKDALEHLKTLPTTIYLRGEIETLQRLLEELKNNCSVPPSQ
jgi:hypothetical protein